MARLYHRRRCDYVSLLTEILPFIMLKANHYCYSPWSFQKPWSELVAQADLMTTTLLPAIDEVVPNPRAYLGEGDFQEPNWQSVFYGENYDKLLSIKDKYDPSHLLYAKTAVGAEYYIEAEDHRLCRS